MDFAITDEQQQISDQVLRLCARFDDAYWLERDRTATFPDAFFAAMAEGHWLGIAMPEHYGGAGLGIVEAALMMQAVAESGAAMSGASAIHINIFGLQPRGRAWHRGAEGADAAAADRGAGEGLLRRDRAECGAEHHRDRDPRGQARRPLRRQRARRSGPRPRRRRARSCCSPAPRRSTRSGARRTG